MTRDDEPPELTSDEAEALYAAGSRDIRGGHPFAARRRFRDAMRIDPGREEYQRGFAFADQCCRVIYLPQYFLVQLYRYFPGGRRGIWLLLLLGAVPLVALEATMPLRAAYLTGLVVFCLYSWSAHWLVAFWIRRFPPH